jgi:signal transduction histidine kinase
MQPPAVLVQFAADAQRAVLTIEDDGCGFIVPPNWLEFARQGHIGLLGAAERAEAIGGRLEVESVVGDGTSIRIVVPASEHQPANTTEG